MESLNCFKNSSCLLTMESEEDFFSCSGLTISISLSESEDKLSLMVATGFEAFCFSTG